MSTLAIPPLNFTALSAGGRNPDKARDAAQQFEALLINQILHSARAEGSGWLGPSDDTAGSCATDFAEQQFAAQMAQAGGLGLADLISRGLTEPSSPPERSSPVHSPAHPGTPPGSR
jgi:Rod binding domain-containing protein